MLEFVFELVFQFFFEVVAEFLFEAGYRGAARVLRSRIVRYGLAAVVGFGFGVWWGDRLSGGHRPYLFWLSLAVAAVSGIAALRRSSEMNQPPPASPVDDLRQLAVSPAGAGRPSWRAIVDPRRWPVHRFVGLAVLNSAVAAGIGVGFDPLP